MAKKAFLAAVQERFGRNGGMQPVWLYVHERYGSEIPAG